MSQQASSPVEFEVAAIHPSTMSGSLPVSVANVVGTRYMIANCSVARWIGFAYEIVDNRVVGPGWIFSDKYDLEAKLPPGAGKKEVPAMLQSLLAGRFGLRVHTETKRERAWALTVTDGSKLRSLLTEGGTVDGPSFPFRTTRPGVWETVCKGCTLAHFADYVSKYIREVVVDTSGLPGVYDIPLTSRAIELIERDRAGAEGFETIPPSIEESLRSVGLKLERRVVGVPHLVVDHVDRPTDN